MSDVDLILTDEFVEYAAKVSDIHIERKAKQEELKSIYEKFKEEIAQLDTSAKEVHAEWEAWKASQVGEKLSVQSKEGTDKALKK